MEALEVIEVVETVSAAPKDNPWGLVIYCAVIFAIIYFLMIRPNKKRMAEYQKMIDGLKLGDRVMAGGIYGKIKKVNTNTFDIEISKGVVVEVNKNAISGAE